MSGYQNLDNLAGTLGNYQSAEAIVFSVLGGLTNTTFELFSWMSLAVVLCVLAWHMLSFKPQHALVTVGSVLVVMAVMAPVAVSVPVIDRETVKSQGMTAAVMTANRNGGGLNFGRCGDREGCVTLPAAYYVLNDLSTRLMYLMMAAIDAVPAVGSQGQPGNLAAVAMPLMASNSTLDEHLQKSELGNAMRLYQDVCGAVVSDVGYLSRGAEGQPLSVKELQTVGLAGGVPPGIEVGAGDQAKDTALRALEKYPPDTLMQAGARARLHVETRDHWLARLGGHTQRKATYLEAPKELQYESNRKGGEPREDTRWFYPENCAELYRTVEIGMQEFQVGARAYFARERKRRTASESYDSQGITSLAAVTRAVWNLQGSTAGEDTSFAPIRFLKKLIGIPTGAGETALVTGIAKVVQFVSEVVGKYVVLLVPALSAVAVFVGAMFYPLICLFALLPGQLARLAGPVWFVVWVKLAILLFYFFVKMGAALGLELARREISGDDTAAYALLLIFNSGALIVAMMSPWVASKIVFSDAYGLANQLTLGKGAVTGAAAATAAGVGGKVMMAAKPVAKVAGGVTRLGASAFRGGIAPSQRPNPPDMYRKK